MKNRKLGLIILICFVLLLCWFLISAVTQHDPLETYQVSVTDSDVTFLPTTIVTNSTNIVVSAPKGQPTLRVCLFYADNKTESIQENKLKAGEKFSFGGLSSRYEYAVGVQTETEYNGQITLEVDYLPVSTR